MVGQGCPVGHSMLTSGLQRDYFTSWTTVPEAEWVIPPTAQANNAKWLLFTLRKREGCATHLQGEGSCLPGLLSNTVHPGRHQASRRELHCSVPTSFTNLGYKWSFLAGMCCAIISNLAQSTFLYIYFRFSRSLFSWYFIMKIPIYNVSQIKI